MRMDRRVQILRAVPVDDGFAMVEGEFAPAGRPQWAGREDAGAAEVTAAGGVVSDLTCRFVLRSNDFTREITEADRVSEGGQVFDVVGVRQIGHLRQIEISARVRRP